MATQLTASRQCRCAEQRHVRRASATTAARSLPPASEQAIKPPAQPRRPFQRLPPVTFSYDKPTGLDVDELADLLSQVSCFSPGQSFHRSPAAVPAAATASSSSDHSSSRGGNNDSSSSSNGANSSSASISSSGAAPVDPARLQGALHRSLVCVAAYASEQHLPPPQHLSSRGLLSLQQRQQEEAEAAAAAAAAPWQRLLPGLQRQRQRRVLVGFARAVGDSTLVATLHDVAVMPELQGLGLGRQLLHRLIKQLDSVGIVDVGLLAPEACHGFFAACSFGRDTEESTLMALSPTGVWQREGLPLAGMSVHVKQVAAQ